MADDPILYRARAAVERANAERATLDNVRERALRSEATFRALAEQARKVSADRAKLQREREAKALADQAAAATD